MRNTLSLITAAALAIMIAAAVHADNGPTRAPGSNTLPFRRTATAGQTVTLAIVGPFTFTGNCHSDGAGGLTAEPGVRTSQDGAQLSDQAIIHPPYGTNLTLNANDGDVRIQYGADGSPSTPDLEAPNSGHFAVVSADLKTYVTGHISSGAHIGGRPLCLFAGVLLIA